jgi:AbrB family looped-hinge helix DNA binding protein
MSAPERTLPKSAKPPVPVGGQNHAAVDAFIDLRSPYSYLALKPARALAQRRGIDFAWWPFITDLKSAYDGAVEARSSRDVVKLKYLYMDCRRLAKQQGLTIRATTKLWDASLASQAMLFAKSRDRLWEFCDPMLAAFWRREFDLESPAALGSALASAGLHVDDWHDYQEASGPGDLQSALKRAEGLGVFGVPTFVYLGEVFWGGDRLAMLEACIDAAHRPTLPNRVVEAAVFSKGQVTLPAAMRAKLGIAVGSRIQFELRDKELLVRPEVPMSAYCGMLKPYLHLFKPEDFEIPKEPDREF